MYGTSPIAAGRSSGSTAARFSASGSGTAQHVLRVCDRFLADFDAAQHARDFLHALRRLQRLDLDARGAVVRELQHAQMMLAERGDLRQVRDAEHLARSGEAAQLLPDDFGDAPADADVDFVEDEGGNAPEAGGHDLKREADARELAAGRDPG